MTQDYKDTLLRYLTGNLNIEPGGTTPQIKEPISSESQIGYYLDSNAGAGYTVIDIIQGYQSSYSIIYGNKANDQGFIVVIDENDNPLQYIEQYNTGTAFGKFQVLNVAEDGKFYGIDINNGTPRFIMLNNIVIKQPPLNMFSVKLRQSYNLPSPLSTATKYFAITKAYNQAKYLIGALTTSNNIDSMLLTELTINVGATNDWVDYAYPETNYDFVGQTLWASWTDDSISFKAGGYQVESNAAYYVEYYLDGSIIQKRMVTIPTISGFSQGNFDIYTIIPNDTVAYVGVFDKGSNGDSQIFDIYSLNYSTATFATTLEVRGNPLLITGAEPRIIFKSISGMTYFLIKEYARYGGVSELHLYVGYLLKTPENVRVVYKQLMAAGDTYVYNFYVTNVYNLYNYHIIGLDYSSSTVGGTNFLVQQVYNESNYNSYPYENTNSLVPNDVILYDSNDLILFARNLYNKSVYNNTTLSVVQIPNTLVNDISIATQNLMGQTKKILVSNTDSITKNIYETVYLNYYNTLLIENRNTQPYIQNETASSLLNQSISLPGDYNTSKATKYRVNYIDGTNEIFDTQATITNGIATFEMQVAVPYDNLILSIDILSSDETTRYQTISGLSSLENGKIYNITQDCYVE